MLYFKERRVCQCVPDAGHGKGGVPGFFPEPHPLSLIKLALRNCL